MRAWILWMRAATLCAMADGIERKLTTIVAADVAAYSRLVRADEEATLTALRGHRLELFNPLIERYGGRIANTAGDSLLLEFPSAVEAVRCAIAVRDGLAARNRDIPDDRQIKLRIGINVGDVVAEGDDLLGDGVNVAARLEGLSEPGGICLSRTARDQVRDHIDLSLEDLGAVEVKNIARPVRAFRIRQAGATPSQRQITAANPAKMAFKLPGKPSIAVLPFDNMTGDQTQDYLSDGLTENIIAVLASSPNLFVIARNSAFTFKGRAVQVQEVAEQLGVRYVLEGSVQKAGERVRVTAQLVDAIDGRHLWADRHDRTLDDIFELQDDIAQNIGLAMQVNLVRGETAQRVSAAFSSAESLKLFLEFIHHWEPWSAAGNQAAEAALEQLMAREPDNPRVVASRGAILWQKVALGLSDNPKQDWADARAFASRAVELDPQEEQGLYLSAMLAMQSGEPDIALALADQAIRVAPNSGYCLAVAGDIKSYCGYPEEGILLLEQAMRIEPIYPEWMPAQLAGAHYRLEHYEEVKDLCRGLLAADLRNQGVRLQALLYLCYVAVQEGDLTTARGCVADARRFRPQLTCQTVLQQNAWQKDQTRLERFIDALREAGLPE